MKNIYLFLFAATVSTVCAAQKSAGDPSLQLQDTLLDHLVGTWQVNSAAHGFSSTAVVEASWAFNHQHLWLRFKGKEIIPWLQVPMEFAYYIGYKHSKQQYVVHQVSVFGNDDYEGFCYGSRNGNELKLLQINPASPDTTIVQRLSWNPAAKSWRINSRPESGNWQGDIFLDMTLTALSSKTKKPTTAPTK